MSDTQSRSTHTALKYSTIALVAKEWLDSNTIDMEKNVEVAFAALNMFFDLILFNHEGGGRINLTTHHCATNIAMRVIQEMNRVIPRPSVEECKEICQTYLDTVNKIMGGEQVNHKSPEVRGLCIFLSILHTHGEEARRVNRYK